MPALRTQHPTWVGRKLRVRLARQGIQPRPYGADDQIRKVQAGGESPTRAALAREWGAVSRPELKCMNIGGERHIMI